jgi:hypothetical protein
MLPTVKNIGLLGIVAHHCIENNDDPFAFASPDKPSFLASFAV